MIEILTIALIATVVMITVVAINYIVRHDYGDSFVVKYNEKIGDLVSEMIFKTDDYSNNNDVVITYKKG